jgi:histidinol phosphatase-like PHP family hydrolase
VNLLEDYHVHSNYNDHSARDLTIANVVKRAESLNLATVAFTEHVRISSNWIEQYLQEIVTIRQITSINLVPGFEAKILVDGSIDCPDYYAKNHFLVASFHTNYTKKNVWLSALQRAIENPCVNVIGHIAPEPTFQIEKHEVEELAALMARHNKIVEINAKYHRPPVSWINILINEGVKMHLGSDAHRLDEVGRFNNILDLVSIADKARLAGSNASRDSKSVQKT